MNAMTNLVGWISAAHPPIPQNTPHVRPGYKQTEVGVIPEDWRLTPLEDICQFENGDRSSNYPSPNSFVSDGIPFINAGHVADGRIALSAMSYIKPESYHRLGGGKVRAGDILFCLRGSLGKFGVVSDGFGEGAIASSLVIIRPKPFSLIRGYLSCYLSSALCKRMIETWAGGAAQPNLGARDLGRFMLPLPPSQAEQRAIATALSDVDALLAAQDKLIAKKRDIKQAAMQQLLTGKQRLPGFSGEWEVKRLGDLLEYEQPTKYLVKDSEYSDDNDVPVLTAGKTFVLGYTNEEHGIFNSLPAIIFDDFTTANKYVTFPFKAKSSAMKILKPRDATVNLRLVFEMMQLIKFQLGDHKRYWISEFQNIQMEVPSAAEQTAIAAVLSDMDTELTALEQQRDKTRALKQGMMQELLTGRIRLV